MSQFSKETDVQNANWKSEFITFLDTLGENTLPGSDFPEVLVVLRNNLDAGVSGSADLMLFAESLKLSGEGHIAKRIEYILNIFERKRATD